MNFEEEIDNFLSKFHYGINRDDRKILKRKLSEIIKPFSEAHEKEQQRYAKKKALGLQTIMYNKLLEYVNDPDNLSIIIHIPQLKPEFYIKSPGQFVGWIELKDKQNETEISVKYTQYYTGDYPDICYEHQSSEIDVKFWTKNVDSSRLIQFFTFLCNHFFDRYDKDKLIEDRVLETLAEDMIETIAKKMIKTINGESVREIGLRADFININDVYFNMLYEYTVKPCTVEFYDSEHAILKSSRFILIVKKFHELIKYF